MKPMFNTKQYTSLRTPLTATMIAIITSVLLNLYSPVSLGNTNQAINQPTSQPINQPTNQLIKQAIELPDIGRIDNASLDEEKRLGAAWIKQYRRGVSTTSDPIVTEYIEQLLENLVQYSEVVHRPLSLVIAKNPTLNAFAVPGGVIGVNTGLLQYAQTEGQLASVLAHELAHLSQRHYARGVEKQKKQSITTTAALLAAIILAASTDGDAGAAALSATQAYSIDQQLRFSRGFEQEADRIGLGILVKAGMDPHATAGVFEQMNRASRFSSKPPEFLLTHPLTSNRISDAINLARGYPKQQVPENINYQLIRSRAVWLTEDVPQQAVIRFKNELSGFDSSPDASRYGLALALTADQQYDEAEEHIALLLEKHPNNMILTIALSDIYAGKGNKQESIELITSLLKLHPQRYPLHFQLAHLYTQQQNYNQAQRLLLTLSKERPEDVSVWFHLAEVAGLNQSIAMLHKARAEYFLLLADFTNAEQQLKALVTREKKAKNGSKDSDLHRYAKNRLAEFDQLKEDAKI